MMKALIVLILLTVMMSSVFAGDCLYFDIKGLRARIEVPVGDKHIKVRVGDVEVNNFFCMNQRSSAIHCDGDDDGGRIIFHDGKLKIKQLHIGNSDKKMFHYDSKKDPEEFKFEKKKCN